jgi:hypothetical protein
VKEVFEITRFGLVLDVFPSVRDALQTLSADAVRAFTVPTQPR